jgi:predicted enzyme related to lactoylglutathione lyase
MAKVIGLGGLFFKSADPDTTREWYGRVLGIAFESWGGTIFLPETAAAHPGAGTVFSPFAATTTYFEPSDTAYMFNLMVDDMDGVLARCVEHGVEPLAVLPDEANGRFAHIIDPDGRKVELWEPRPMV